MGRISEEDYARDVDRAIEFLEGRTQDVIERYRAKMAEASARWAFEEAALYRDRIAALTTLQEQQVIETTGGDTDADILSAVSSGAVACVNLAMVRGGRHLGDRPTFPKVAQRSEALMPTALEILEAYADQHYEDMPIPAVVIVDVEGAEKTEAQAFITRLEEMLTARAERRVNVVSEPRDARRRWLEMCREGAKVALQRTSKKKGISSHA